MASYTNVDQGADTLPVTSEIIPKSVKYEFLEVDAATFTNLAVTNLRVTTITADSAVLVNSAVYLLSSSDASHAIQVVSNLRIHQSGALHVRGSDGNLYSCTVVPGEVTPSWEFTQITDLEDAGDLDYSIAGGDPVDTPEVESA